MRRLAIVLADGLRPDAVAPGIMPSLDALGGAFTLARQAHTVRPSATVAALASLATGVSPQTHRLTEPGLGFLSRLRSLRPVARELGRAGIPTDVYKILAYVICSALAGLGAVLYLLDNRTANATSAGSLLELYAITGAVLGGCSLRGGEGSVPGILIGTSILVLLPNLTTMWGIPQELERTVIGAALLLGAILDELLRRRGKE